MTYIFECNECGAEVVFHTDNEKDVPRWVKCLKRGCAKKVYRNDIKSKKEGVE